MDRLKDIQFFLEDDKNHHIEPVYRCDDIYNKIAETVSTFRPDTIVKAGLGNPEYCIKLIDNNDSILVIVDPSIKNLISFKTEYMDTEHFDRVKLINGTLEDLPIDYYKSHLLICADYLDFLNSSRVIDEFRRALEFECLLFIGTTVLAPEDIEGVYDEIITECISLHNEFYIESDLKTVLELNEFNLLNSELKLYTVNLKEKVEYLGNASEKSPDDVKNLFKSREEPLKDCYGFNDTSFNEYYHTGLYMRKKYEESDDPYRKID